MYVAFLALAVAAPPTPPETDNLYRSAKVGDWVEYTYSGPPKFVSRQTVTARAADKLTLKTEQIVDGKAGETTETVIDLKGPYPPAAKDPKPAYTTNTELLETSKETRKVRGRSLECEIVKRRTTMKPTGGGKESVAVLKYWTSNDVPLGGLVRMETDVGGTKMVTELTGWGRGK
jgi:hypothetical protein